jgi:predicted dehydrogenase
VVRALAGAEPAVVSAKALLRSPEIDRTMEAELSFADGRSGRIFCSMWSAHVVGFSATVIGDDATLQVFNPFSPHVFHRLTVRGHGARRVEHVRDMSTYAHQLAAFAAAVHDGTPVPTDATDAVANMQVIDDIYRAAGLQPRTPTGSTR